VTSFVVVGSGWRAAMFWRLAAGLDDVECLGAVVRTPRSLPVPTFASLDEVRPDFVVTAVPWPVNPGVIRDAVGRGLPVLAETPPAPDLPGLRALWDAVGARDLVQVAEQYLLVPAHAARLAAVRAGTIGTPTQVQVSSTHQYHAVSMIRGFLGAGRGPVTVRASRTTAPLVDPLVRDAWSDDDTAKPATTVIATLDFGSERSGLYDEVVRLLEPRTVVRTPLVRRQTGYDLDLDGFETDHITLGDRVLFRNPFIGRRYNDEEIAMSTLLRQMAAWVRGAGPAPYPLAEGIHDHQVALAIEESADTDRPVTTTTEAWTR
jgi:predicted dehydrogenase